jgi:hypothetical protein
MFAESVPFFSIDIGNVLTLGGLFLQGYLLLAKSNRQHGANSEKIQDLVRWKEGHDLDARQRDAAIVELKIISAGMEAAALAMQRSVDIMQRQLDELLRRDRSGRMNDDRR